MNGIKIGTAAVAASALLIAFACSADPQAAETAAPEQVAYNDISRYDVIKCDDVKELGSLTNAMTLCRLHVKGGNQWSGTYRLTSAGLVPYVPSANLVPAASETGFVGSSH
jgi:hypothetical protein